jgi:hypothetical protein
LLAQRLRDALARLNPALPAEAPDDAFRKLTRPEGAELVAQSRALHRLPVDGVTVEYRATDGESRGAQARVIDFDQPSSTAMASSLHLAALTSSIQPTSFLAFSRDRDDFEVDIVIERGHGAVAGVEVKAGASVTESDLRGLRKLRDTAGTRFAAGVILYDGAATIRFERNLFAVPVRKLWEET